MLVGQHAYYNLLKSHVVIESARFVRIDGVIIPSEVIIIVEYISKATWIIAKGVLVTTCVIVVATKVKLVTPLLIVIAIGLVMVEVKVVAGIFRLSHVPLSNIFGTCFMFPSMLPGCATGGPFSSIGRPLPMSAIGCTVGRPFTSIRRTPGNGLPHHQAVVHIMLPCHVVLYAATWSKYPVDILLHPLQQNYLMETSFKLPIPLQSILEPSEYDYLLLLSDMEMQVSRATKAIDKGKMIATRMELWLAKRDIIRTLGYTEDVRTPLS
eukprot:Gb_36004 [translate_table: standard]